VWRGTERRRLLGRGESHFVTVIVIGIGTGTVVFVVLILVLRVIGC